MWRRVKIKIKIIKKIAETSPYLSNRRIKQIKIDVLVIMKKKNPANYSG